MDLRDAAVWVGNMFKHGLSDDRVKRFVLERKVMGIADQVCLRSKRDIG